MNRVFWNFGLLDEKGMLVRQNYKNTKRFVQLVIKPAISEIDALEPNIEFLISEEGDFGFQKIKKGRTIVAMRFLFEWKKGKQKTQSLARLNQA